jgi:hypothetical protein
MTDTKATLLLVLTCALLSSLALAGLVRAESSVPSSLGGLRHLPPHQADVGAEGLEGYRIEVAAAIDAATPEPRLRALLLAMGWRESRFRMAVGRGAILGDGGKAYGLWQSWDPDRTGGLKGQARRAVEHLEKARRYCARRGARPYEGAISLYATGRTCYWNRAPSRARLARKLLARMYSAP